MNHTDRHAENALAHRRKARERIALDPEAEERLRKARAALGLTKQTTTKETR